MDGAWIISPEVHLDDRGSFMELFSSRKISRYLGREVSIAQVNMSTSRSGVVRGIHTRVRHSGEAKMVSCLSGEIFDVAVDLRSESPTFGQWRGVWLSESASRLVLLEEGFGHAFYVASGEAVVVYGTSRTYDPSCEISIHPMDPDIGIEWPIAAKHILSPRDATAPRLADARLSSQ